MSTFPSDSNRGTNFHQYLQDIKTFIFAKISIGLCSYVTKRILSKKYSQKMDKVALLLVSKSACLSPVAACLQESMSGLHIKLRSYQLPFFSRYKSELKGLCHETDIFKAFKILSVLFVCALMVFRIFEQLTVVIFNFYFFYLFLWNYLLILNMKIL